MTSSSEAILRTLCEKQGVPVDPLIALASTARFATEADPIAKVMFSMDKLNFSFQMERQKARQQEAKKRMADSTLLVLDKKIRDAIQDQENRNVRSGNPITLDLLWVESVPESMMEQCKDQMRDRGYEYFGTGEAYGVSVFKRIERV